MHMMKTTFLIGMLTGFFMLAGYWLGGTTGALIALLLAGLTNFGMYWFSHKIVLKMQKAVPLDKKEFSHIYRIVEKLAQKDALPMPALYFVDTPIPNAFATGRSQKHGIVAVTRGIVDILDENELEAVLAHELGHIKNRDMLVSTITATAAGAITLLADFAFWGGALFGGDEEDNWLGELALLLLAPIGATIIQLAVSRTREFGADQHAGHLLGHGDYLISALQKLESFKHEVGTAQFHPKDQATAHLMFQNMFSMHGIGKLFSTHPSTEDRIKKLQS